MSAAPKIIEGTWEEVAPHAEEFAGHRLRVMVLEDGSAFGHPAFDTSPGAVQMWIEKLRKWSSSQPLVTPPADDSRDSIYQDRLDAHL